MCAECCESAAAAVVAAVAVYNVCDYKQETLDYKSNCEQQYCRVEVEKLRCRCHLCRLAQQLLYDMVLLLNVL
jgi:IS1 family transposase